MSVSSFRTALSVFVLKTIYLFWFLTESVAKASLNIYSTNNGTKAKLKIQKSGESENVCVRACTHLCVLVCVAGLSGGLG